jgi:hypothetical protein
MARTNTDEKWLKPDHPLRTALEGMIHEDISVDQFLGELWLEGYKIATIEEKDYERHDH